MKELVSKTDKRLQECMFRIEEGALDGTERTRKMI
jgi:hypothetical protein